ncbi:hypothetical protein K488DRAFT_43074 [Vararia minispora EC-137]|uniref:Uncharacterized protein n=1 Tax=Vararia minispora EC-137 TaxID=1314806 RepID=A0ACB8QUM6_9AGAM|nr:hypothetical protein K488DRAFT_43074 [Vararia minispora EC-137]
MEKAKSAAKQPKLDVEGYLTTALSSTPQELHQFFQSFLELHSRKLWHQLTLKLAEFFDYPLAKPFRVEVFSRFIRDFEEKLNALRLVEMGVIVSEDITNPVSHLEFLIDLLSRISKDKSPDAHVVLLSTVAHSKLSFGDVEGCRADIDAAWEILDDLNAVEPSVNATYYRAKAEYAPYYRNSLLYLACVDVQRDVNDQERLMRAHDLGVSALLGDTIYNFGELLLHPILNALDGTPYEWIKKLLFTFNEGNIGKFEALAPVFPKEPILQENFPFLRQKICLMALIESVFRRNAYDRTMTFQTIAEETRLAIDDVEHLLMKALSLKLIQGFIDQVEQKASITWVQPRVLSRQQIGALADRLKEWNTRLHGVEERVAPELLVTA